MKQLQATHSFLRTFQSIFHHITTFDLGGSSVLREHQIIHPATAPSAGLFIVHHTHINHLMLHNT